MPRLLGRSPQANEPSEEGSEVGLLSIDVAIDRLGLTRAQIYREIGEKNLKSEKVGDRQQFKSEELDRFVEETAESRTSLRKTLDSWLALYEDRRVNSLIPIESIDPLEGDVSDSERAQVLAERMITDIFTSRIEDFYLDPIQDGDRVLVRSEGQLSTIGTIRPELSNILKPEIKTLVSAPDLDDTGTSITTFERTVDGARHQLRIAITKTILGELIHFHLLSRTSDDMTLSEIGLSEDQVVIIGEILSGRPGVLVFAGPAGDRADSYRLTFAEALQPKSKVIVSLEHRVQFRNENLVQLDIGPPNGPIFADVWESAIGMTPDGLIIDDIADGFELRAMINAVITGIPVLAQVRNGGIVGALRAFSSYETNGEQLVASLAGFIEFKVFRRLNPETSVVVEADEIQTGLLGAKTGISLRSPGPELPYIGKISIFGVAVPDSDLAGHLSRTEIDWQAIREWTEAGHHGVINTLKLAVQNGLISFEDAAPYLG